MKSKLNIYVVEDNEITARIVKYRLENQFHANVLTMDSVEDALGNIIINKPDLIILDFTLTSDGYQDGIQLIKQLKRRDINIPTILFSGCIDKGLAIEMLKNGACDFVSKRGDYMTPLIEAVRNVVIRLEIKNDIIEIKDRQGYAMMSARTLGLMSLTIISLLMLMT